MQRPRMAGWRRPVAGFVVGTVAALGSRTLIWLPRVRADGANAPEVPDDEEYARAEALLARAGFGPPRAVARQAPPSPDTSSGLCAPFDPPNGCSTAQRVLVVGGGIMGSAAAYSLARRNEGHRVTLVDTGHPIRSSWGQERAARLAYDEPMFVQMMQRAFMLWGELQESDAAGRKVLRPGVRMDVAPRGVLDSLKKTQAQMGLALQVFGSQSELDKRFPQIKLREGEEAVRRPVIVHTNTHARARTYKQHTRDHRKQRDYDDDAVAVDLVTDPHRGLSAGDDRRSCAHHGCLRARDSV